MNRRYGKEVTERFQWVVIAILIFFNRDGFSPK